jgi:hypothetical protein
MRKHLVDFKGGLVLDPPSYRLGENEFQQLNNVTLEPWGGLILRKGQRQIATSGAFTGVEVDGLYRGASGILYYRKNNGVSGEFFSYNENTSTETSLYAGDTNGFRTYFQIFQSRVLATLGAGGVAWFTGGTARALGLAASSTACAVANGGAGSLSTTNLPAYRYYITNFNGTCESNPNPISPGITGAAFQTNLSSIPLGPTGTTARFIYRVGGLASKPTKIATIADNTTTTYTDNIADKDLGTTYLSFSRDPPPTTGGLTMLSAKGRLILASSTTVYVSNLNDPDAFPTQITYRSTDGFQFNIDPDNTNEIQNMCSAGSAVFIARRKDCFLLMGNDTDSWALSKIADIGCVAPRSVVSCADIVCWVGPDAMVWALGDKTPIPIGLPLRKALRALNRDYLGDACGCYFRQQYHLCFPQAPSTYPSKYFVYDFTVGAWFDLSNTYMTANVLFADPEAKDNGEVLIAYKSGSSGTMPDGLTIEGIGACFWQAQVENFTIQSGDLEFDEPTIAKRITKVRVRGKNQINVAGVGGTTTLTLTAVMDRSDGTTTTASREFDLNPGEVSTTTAEGVLLDTEVPSTIQGHRITYTITAAKCRTFELHDIYFEYEYVRPGRL